MGFLKKILAAIGFLFYLVIGCFFIALSIRAIDPKLISQYITDSYKYPDLLVFIRIIGVVLILKGIIFVKHYLANDISEKIITFDNPDGQVVVSLSAVEEYINKIAKNMKQVKDLRPVVSKTKKGLEVKVKATIFSDANVPAVTEQLQQRIKEKVMDMLGIEESVDVMIHVSKFFQTDSKHIDTDDGSSRIPYAE
ncbi:MAG: alkaline shock response membrane anchor protein AmaP [Candidatus Omnitrophica bacterium]|nr:alkaline shock response membrane anchor protein AmaP [Candidatus Omnitrophota bacterium]